MSGQGGKATSRRTPGPPGLTTRGREGKGYESGVAWPGRPARKLAGWDYVPEELRQQYVDTTGAFGEAAYQRAVAQGTWGRLYGESLKRGGRKRLTQAQWQQCVDRTTDPRRAAISCVLRPAHVPSPSGQRLVNPFYNHYGDGYEAANAALAYIQQADPSELASILNYTVDPQSRRSRRGTPTPQAIADYLSRSGGPQGLSAAELDQLGTDL